MDNKEPRIIRTPADHLEVIAEQLTSKPLDAVADTLITLSKMVRDQEEYLLQAYGTIFPKNEAAMVKALLDTDFLNKVYPRPYIVNPTTGAKVIELKNTGPIVELDPTTFHKLVNVRINNGGTHFEDIPATVTVEKEADNVFPINFKDEVNAQFEAEKARALAVIAHIEKMQAAHNAR